MADKKKMSVEDILTACRRADSGETSASPRAAEVESKLAERVSESELDVKKPAAQEPSAMSVADVSAAARGAGGGAKSEAAAVPKASAGSAAKKPSEMSVADILAAARKGAPASQTQTVEPKARAAVKEPAKPKPAAKPAADGEAARGGPMDTSSILATARSGVKPGPISKSEAAMKPSVARHEPAKPILPPMPQKPAYAKASPQKQVESEDRRGFLSIVLGSFLAVGFTSLTLTNLLWTLGLARFMFPNILIEPPSRFKVGFPSDFAPSTVDERFKAQFGVWLTNVEYNGQQQIVALKTVCTHLGCTPNWLEAEQKFKCPCHGSGFYKDGINFEGPAPRPLERYAIRLADDGQLEVDKSKIFQQEMGQWNDPASFVPV
jgi:cytochrome b6-f complex iron-sulfur subunit